MKLHKECKKRLLEELTEYLPEITVSNNKYVNYKSTYNLDDIDRILPVKGEVIKEYQNMIDETPFYTFLIEEMQRPLKNYEYKLDEKDKKYFELLPEPNLETLSNKLIDDFEKLPRDYKLFIKIPDCFHTLLKYYDKEIIFNDNLRIIELTDDFIINTKLDTTSKVITEGIFKFRFADLQEDHNYLEKDKLYLEITTKGYNCDYYFTETLSDSINTIKYLYGLGLARSLFRYNSNYSSNKSDGIKTFSKIDGNWIYDSYHNLPDDLKECIYDIEFVNNPIGPNENINKDFLTYNVQLIGKLLSGLPKTQKILEASKWFFEGMSGNNELLSFIQNTVVLEILLGDKSKSDIIGIGELLRNRCAYLISENDEERQNILKDFNEIYEIRSQIVHRGKSKLNNNERRLLTRLRYFCSRVLFKEINYLKV
ncbi:MAG: hypothetical protein K9H48_20855 [Melioribacteraceae bacterium]|nr:hypothetical protein [Melioribacteraceae bacterium]MCF8394306.1 hypothetical protein [Melioribacteraceae bacterium]MCF8419985.1 hypothetical protein [Melioribacteraceae bacterium]